MIEEGQNECPNPESHSTIFHRLPFCPPEVALGSSIPQARNWCRRTTGFCICRDRTA
jgi:hypothetical protein